MTDKAKSDGVLRPQSSQDQAGVRIEVVPYDPKWPRAFAAERKRLAHLLEAWLEGEIEHVGSTAVDGLCAKPVIDIMAPVSTLDHSRDAVSVVSELGYLYYPHRPEVMHWLCKPSPQLRTHHLYLIPFGSQTWNDRLFFRDRLRADPQLAAEYAELKMRLAKHHRADREAYTAAKDPFVQRVLASSRLARDIA